ncbi:hypothetical protein [Phenylobacterium sp. SCN 70-31]|uniref:hypothetical protein n=1 Tax=Phenylobacterium sp. SCN 70-31 TaxID=1660129 RepID=UPI00086BD3AF|nr:hypothetical protein [Phenylobacterium sp. SCN 70-31]ODT87295.1 MAG: hypothetical protein ABS78_12855 [Phenylobacterium sp. SCN 70-31]
MLAIAPSLAQAQSAEAPPPSASPAGPVFIHETGRSPGGPPTAEEIAYDARLKSSAAAIRAFQGPMEGAWTLSAGGHELYLLQLVDRDGWIDGAWRDPRRPGAPEASGLIVDVPRGAELTLRFADDSIAVLHPSGGHWTGRLTEAGRSQAVTLSRRAP